MYLKTTLLAFSLVFVLNLTVDARPFYGFDTHIVSWCSDFGVYSQKCTTTENCLRGNSHKVACLHNGLCSATFTVVKELKSLQVVDREGNSIPVPETQRCNCVDGYTSELCIENATCTYKPEWFIKYYVFGDKEGQLIDENVYYCATKLQRRSSNTTSLDLTNGVLSITCNKCTIIVQQDPILTIDVEGSKVLYITDKDHCMDRFILYLTIIDDNGSFNYHLMNKVDGIPPYLCCKRYNYLWLTVNSNCYHIWQYAVTISIYTGFAAVIVLVLIIVIKCIPKRKYISLNDTTDKPLNGAEETDSVKLSMIGNAILSVLSIILYCSSLPLVGAQCNDWTSLTQLSETCTNDLCVISGLAKLDFSNPGSHCFILEKLGETIKLNVKLNKIWYEINTNPTHYITDPYLVQNKIDTDNYCAMWEHKCWCGGPWKSEDIHKVTARSYKFGGFCAIMNICWHDIYEINAYPKLDSQYIRFIYDLSHASIHVDLTANIISSNDTKIYQIELTDAVNSWVNKDMQIKLTNYPSENGIQKDILLIRSAGKARLLNKEFINSKGEFDKLKMGHIHSADPFFLSYTHPPEMLEDAVWDCPGGGLSHYDYKSTLLWETYPMLKTWMNGSLVLQSDVIKYFPAIKTPISIYVQIENMEFKKKEIVKADCTLFEFSCAVVNGYNSNTEVTYNCVCDQKYVELEEITNQTSGVIDILTCDGKQHSFSNKMIYTGTLKLANLIRPTNCSYVENLIINDNGNVTSLETYHYLDDSSVNYWFYIMIAIIIVVSIIVLVIILTLLKKLCIITNINNTM